MAAIAAILRNKYYTVMRFLAFALLSLLVSYSAKPNGAEQRMIDELERRVVLPPGAGKLACYERYYAPTTLSQITGRPVPQDLSLLQGMYILGNQPGIHWKRNAKDFPGMNDAGCAAIEIMYDTAKHQLLWPAECSAGFNGMHPKEVVPPVTC